MRKLAKPELTQRTPRAETKGKKRLTQSRKVAKGEKTVNENELAKVVVDAAYRVHVELGPALLESVYETVLAYELAKRGLDVKRQVLLPIRYDGKEFEETFRIDLLIHDKLILELKSVENVQAVHLKQLLTYLRLADKRLGLLLNFGMSRMKDGIERVTNGMPD